MYNKSAHSHSSALASPEFENREGEELGQHLARRLVEAYHNTSAIDLSQLCVIPGQQCWILYVDALVSEQVVCIDSAYYALEFYI